jgi:hypothetical protein
MRPLESLSRRQRQATPPAFAAWLVDRVRKLCGPGYVACLWIAETSVYHQMLGCDLWPESRDARLYEGPYPVICHPPCGPWGKYRSNCFHSREHGLRALELVHRWGGVIEHPVGSHLFRQWGKTPLEGVTVELVNQGDFGHLAVKPTLLYWYRGEGRE